MTPVQAMIFSCLGPGLILSAGIIALLRRAWFLGTGLILLSGPGVLFLVLSRVAGISNLQWLGALFPWCAIFGAVLLFVHVLTMKVDRPSGAEAKQASDTGASEGEEQ